MGDHVQPPDGYAATSSPCASEYLCFSSSAAVPMNPASYRELSSNFGMKLTTSHCDPPLATRVGFIEECYGYGRQGDYELVSTLNVVKGRNRASTEIAFAPVRRV